MSYRVQIFADRRGDRPGARLSVFGTGLGATPEAAVRQARERTKTLGLATHFGADLYRDGLLLCTVHATDPDAISGAIRKHLSEP